MCQTLHPNNAERRRGLVEEAYASVLRLRQEVQEIAARQDEDSGSVNLPPPNLSSDITVQPRQPSSNSLASRQPLAQDDRPPHPNQPPRGLTESQRIAAISEMVMQRRFLLANRIIRERANSRRILIARRMVGARANSQPVPGRAVGWLQRHPPSAISTTGRSNSQGAQQRRACTCACARRVSPFINPRSREVALGQLAAPAPRFKASFVIPPRVDPKDLLGQEARNIQILYSHL